MNGAAIAPVAAGVVVDHLLGEPPLRWHPVARFGTFVGAVERRIYDQRRRNGVVLTLVGVGSALGIGIVMRRLLGRRLSTFVATSVCVAGRMLDDEASRIATHLLDNDLPGARLQLRSLVGRTTDDLDEAAISRAVVESVAENAVDAVTASMFWAAIGGAPAVLAHRAINTLDAMVGHRNERYELFGWASARLDDVVNYLPARLTALAVAVARPSAAANVWRVVRRDAGRHPSPNGGVVEAAFAAALGVQLGGVNHYSGRVEDRGTLGDGPLPAAVTVAQATRLRRHATVATAGLLLVSEAMARNCIVAQHQRRMLARRFPTQAQSRDPSKTSGII